MLDVPGGAEEVVHQVHTVFDLCIQLLISAALGLVVSGSYWLSQRRPASEVYPLAVTIVLLTTLVTMTTMVIGDSTARAFGLVGVLSIVRFRTVVEDTRDTAFVIFAVAVGMAVGADNLTVAFIGIPVVSVVSIAMGQIGSRLKPAGRVYGLELRIGSGHDLEQPVQSVLDQFAMQSKVVSVVTARQGISLDLNYQIQLKPDAQLLKLVKSLNQIEGVQGIEVREPK